ncbi:MAG: hypothetical protein AAB601_00810 [Patescibacteria group bacterium]
MRALVLGVVAIALGVLAGVLLDFPLDVFNRMGVPGLPPELAPTVWEIVFSIGAILLVALLVLFVLYAVSLVLTPTRRDPTVFGSRCDEIEPEEPDQFRNLDPLAEMREREQREWAGNVLRGIDKEAEEEFGPLKDR